MAERGRYRTRQQSQILDSLKMQDAFLTVEQLVEYLHGQGLHIGQTTVYRTLDRLTQDGLVIKIPSVNGSKAQYRYLGDEVHTEPGKMVCLRCGHILPLECTMLDDFSSHIREMHGFSLARQYLVLYGYCSECRDATDVDPRTRSGSPDGPGEFPDLSCACCSHSKPPRAVIPALHHTGKELPL